MVKNFEKRLDGLEKRIEKIERTIYGEISSKLKTKKHTKKSFTGLIGGIELFIENGFFKTPKLVTEVQDELKREGYYHSIQATDTALRRSFVKSKKILTRVKIDGIWQYVVRK